MSGGHTVIDMPPINATASSESEQQVQRLAPFAQPLACLPPYEEGTLGSADRSLRTPNRLGQILGHRPDVQRAKEPAHHRLAARQDV